MKMLVGRRLPLSLGLVALALLAGLAAWTAGRADAQNPDAKANYGEKELQAGFEPDPFTVKVEAGGDEKTDKGDVKAFVSKTPDFRLKYTAGNFPLTFKVESKADTTLLINLPDGKWIANDDADGGLNPRITIEQPKSGRYEIWVGTLKGGATPPATLFITELKQK